MAEKVSIEIEAKIKQALKDIEAVKDSVSEIQNESKKSGKAIEGIGKGVGKLKNGFKGIGLAIKAMGIGLLLAAFTKLQEAFMANQTTAEAFGKIGIVLQGVFNGLVEVAKPLIETLGNLFTKPKETLQELLDKVKEFGTFVFDQTIGRVLTALEKAFLNVGLGVGKMLVSINKVLGRQEAVAHFEGEIAEQKERIAELDAKQEERAEKRKEVAEKIKTSVKETRDAFVETVKATADNAEELAKAEATMRKQEILQQRILEQKDKEAEEQRQIRDDVRLSLEERIAANDKLTTILQEQSDAEKATVQSRIDLLQKQQNLLGFNADRANEILALENELLAVDAKITGFQSEQRVNEAGLLQEKTDRLALEKEGELELQRIKTDSAIEVENNELKKLQLSLDRIKKEKDAELALLKDKQAIYAEDTIQYQEFQNQINAINATSKATELAVEKQIQKQKADIVMGALSALKSAVGENTKAGKALGVSEALVNTYVGATAALKNPFPMNIVALAGTLASGFASVRSILAVDETGTESLPSEDAVSASMTAGPSVSLTAGALDPNTQLLGALNESMNKPAKSYVVGTDVTSQQALDRRILENATL